MVFALLGPTQESRYSRRSLTQPQGMLSWVGSPTLGAPRHLPHLLVRSCSSRDSDGGSRAGSVWGPLLTGVALTVLVGPGDAAALLGWNWHSIS